LQAVVEHLKKKYPEAKLYGLGVEYGANLLVLHAAKSGKKLYDGLVSIGNPLDLEKSERNIKGLWKLTLEKQLIACRSKKANLQEQPSTLYDVDLHEHHLKPEQLASFKQSISSINSIKDLQTQTLFLNSLTDPFSLYY
jgi:predicted alpha/beta-fold hydrolase